MSKSSVAAVVAALLAFALYAVELRGWELIVPGVVVALALLPLPFRRWPRVRRAVAVVCGLLCLAWATRYLVYAGIVLVPTGLLLLSSARTPRRQPERLRQPLPMCIDELRAALGALVTGRYDDVVSLAGDRLTTDKVAAAIAAYPYRPTVYPQSWLADSVVTERRSDEGRAWSVAVPFWTEEEGRSDLEAHFDVRVDEQGACAVELRDIRVP